ncbi:MAG: transglutaminase domain-containing protein [Chitinophagaceae bacterium]|nr:MAG: transglutaminase domain-containing protein [Chitinophagaceae bacterium]
MEQELAIQEKYASFCRRLEGGIKTVQTYEDPQQQAVALEHIDFNTILQYLEENKAASEQKSTGQGEAELVLQAIMRWFKQDFFQWCNQPVCAYMQNHSGDDAMQTHSMQNHGIDTPSAEEREQGWAGRTELYLCEVCSTITRFARCNNPAYLLNHPAHRRGRCGEWANAFGLVLRALGFDVRCV